MDPVALSPVSLFLQSGLVGKSVMLLLLAMSVWCWVLIVVIAVSIGRLRRAVRAAHARTPGPLIAPILAAGAAIVDIPGETVGELRVRMQEAMNRGGRILIGRAECGLPHMAVIASIAPFVGLFGTVWGIMTAFAGIAEARDTSLAVVAPGIAEALAATAIGLAAAIPASVGYSALGSALGRAAGDLSDLIEEESTLLLGARNRRRGAA